MLAIWWCALPTSAHYQYCRIGCSMKLGSQNYSVSSPKVAIEVGVGHKVVHNIEFFIMLVIYGGVISLPYNHCRVCSKYLSTNNLSADSSHTTPAPLTIGIDSNETQHK